MMVSFRWERASYKWKIATHPLPPWVGLTIMIIISVMIMSASYGIPILQHIPTTTEERWA